MARRERRANLRWRYWGASLDIDDVEEEIDQVLAKVVFQIAEVAVPSELFRAILEGIGRLRLPAAASG